MNVFVFEDDIQRIDFFTKLVKLFECDEFIITDNLRLAQEKLKSIKWDIAFLDHDINNAEYTGCDVAKFIVKNKIEIPQIYIHSMNPVGSENIRDILPHAMIKPFSKIFEIYRREIL